MMAYEKRAHGRGFDDLREITAKVGVIPRADGSAYFKIGGTAAYAAVYGPRNLYPRFLQNHLQKSSQRQDLARFQSSQWKDKGNRNLTAHIYANRIAKSTN